MIGEWLPRFACPECQGRLGADAASLACERCGRRFDCSGGIFRLMRAGRAEAARPFLEQYRLVRDREGYRGRTPEFYRSLPKVARDDPHRDEWCVRRESFEHLCRDAADALSPGARILDLGAGNGWLSHRLVTIGHHAVAVDWLDDAADGLGACRHYPASFARVQADFDALPFEPGQFDLAVLGGSLHYSPDPSATLAGAAQMLRRGGALVVMDSPMFARAEDGEAMVAAVHRQLRRAHGVAEPLSPGVGFLTFDGLERAFLSLGLRPRFCRSHGPLRWRVRRPFARMRLGRAPAAFGVWIAR